MNVVAALKRRVAPEARADRLHTQSPVSFPDLVRLHQLWRRGLDAAAGKGEPDGQTRRSYHSALAAFEREHGRIVNSYWCSQVESAAALTIKPAAGMFRRFKPVRMRFHRVSDWATKDRPTVAGLLHECDELAIRASEVLREKSRRICMQLVMASAGHLLSLVDDPAAHDREQHVREALELQRRELAGARAYYREAANGEAQIVYFAGMALGIVVLGGVAAIVGGWLNVSGIDDRTFFGCLTAGALGALVSVIARINAGSFSLHYDVGRGYTLFLGSLRPVIGAIFGLTLYFATTSGFLHIFELPTKGSTKEFYFLFVIAFLAGFSERWAQDTLTGGETAALSPHASEKEPTKR